MLKTRKKHDLFRRFLDNKDGNMTATFALSLTLVVIAVGAGTDFSALSAANGKAQSLADSTALAAAVYIRDHDRPPPTDADGYRDGVTYSATDLGYEFNNSVEGGNDGVSIRVDYDDNAKETTVTIQGATSPNFTQVFGKDRLPFTAKSVVSYLEAEDSFPASISLVLDNSGSMAWDDLIALPNGRSPANAQPRITGLERSVDKFTRELENRLDIPNKPYETVRMGMLPYSSDIVDDNRVRLERGNPGFLSTTQITDMQASGNTNSNPPMAAALEELNNEFNLHRNQADKAGVPYVEPLKFVVFMSDGQNTVGVHRFIPDSSTNQWYRPNTAFSSGFERFRYTRAHWNAVNEFTEGRLELISDELTIDSCETLHTQGVEIFTIGYALEVGLYNRNLGATSTQVALVTDEVQANAFNLLQKCASKPENFVIANDTVALEAAFDTIQNAIVEELIRIKS